MNLTNTPTAIQKLLKNACQPFSIEPFSPFGVSVVYMNDEGVAPKGWVGILQIGILQTTIYDYF